MYMHIVMMEFSPSADTEFFGRVQAYADRIRAECQGVNMYHFGANGAARADGLTFAVVSAFEDAAQHDAYQVSPAHQEMKAYMGPYIRRMAVFDGDAPLLG
jgi:quinol monooxygenase YgiN